MVKEAYIKELCERFNCSKEDLINILSQYEISRTLTIIIILGVLLVLAVNAVFIGNYISKKFGCKHEETAFALMLGGTLISLIAVIFLIVKLPDYVSFINEPISAAGYFIDSHLSITGF